MNNFNYIIPLGEECYTSQSIDKKFNIDLRKVSLPFDYVGGTQDTIDRCHHVNP